MKCEECGKKINKSNSVDGMCFKCLDKWNKIGTLWFKANLNNIFKKKGDKK